LVDFGDPIGAVQGGIDYSTGYTYVDRRLGKNNKPFIALVDSDGNVDLRDASQDSSSADYKQMKQWIEQQKAAGAAGAAGQPPSGYSPPGPPPSSYGPPGLPPSGYVPHP
jgi:hypothetical protein